MSILKKLEDEYIVDFDLSEDKKSLEVMERCDYWYKINLNKKEVCQLIDELASLYLQMKD